MDDDQARHLRTMNLDEVPSPSTSSSDDDDDDETPQNEPTADDVPLELGGFLAPHNHTPRYAATILTEGRELNPGDAVRIEGRPYEIVRRGDSRAKSGPAGLRHKVELGLVELFDKGRVGEAMVVGATERVERVGMERGRWTVVCFSLFLSLSLSCSFFIPLRGLRLILSLGLALFGFPFWRD